MAVSFFSLERAAQLEYTTTLRFLDLAERSYHDTSNFGENMLYFFLNGFLKAHHSFVSIRQTSFRGFT